MAHGEENIKRALKDFGLTETETEVYLFLAKHDALKGTQVAKQIKKDKAQVYHILKSLEAKGLVESTLEAPVRFVPVPFEKVVESTIKAKHEEAERIESARKELIENWKSIIKHVPEIQQEKLVIIEGKRKIYSKMLTMVNETRSQFSASSIFPVLSRSDQFGILNAASHHPLKSKVQFRFLVEFDERNQDSERTLVNMMPSSGVNLKVCTIDSAPKPCPKMVIRDEEEAIFFVRSESYPISKEHNDTCLWTNSKPLVLAFLAVFDERWSKATGLPSIIGQVKKTKEKLSGVWENAQQLSANEPEAHASFLKLKDNSLIEITPASSALLSEPALVGREHELQELQSLLDTAMNGKGKTVFLSGEAGSGKTRLAAEFLKTARKQNVLIMRGWCLSNASVPYFPFFEVFNTYFPEENPKENLGAEFQEQPNEPEGTSLGEIKLKDWLLGPSQDMNLGRPKLTTPQAWKDQTFIAVANTLSSISATQPLILFIDDMHWADSASIALVHYIARTILDGSKRVLVLATFRSDELTADAEGHPHPLAEELRSMSREDLFKEIKLSNLDKGSVTKIAENMIGGKIKEDFAEKLANESRGNALFIVESIRMLIERNGLIQENNEWRLTVDELGIPTKVKDIIMRRLAALKRDQRRVLDAACVIGEKFDEELLAATLSLDRLTVLETLNSIAQSSSLVQCFEDHYRFDHARSRESLYEEIPLPLKKGYHLKVAETLETANLGGNLPVSDLAYHYARAENKEKAVTYSLAAGQEALLKWSNTEAIHHFNYVLQTIGDNPKLVKERDIADEGLGDAFFASSNFKEAIKTFEELANETVNEDLKLRVLSKAREAAFKLGDAVALWQLTTRSEPITENNRLEKAKVMESKGLLFAMHITEQVLLGESEKAAGLGDMKIAGPSVIENFKAALKIFGEEYSLLDAAFALAYLGVAFPGQGNPEEGVADGLLAVAIASESGDIDLKLWCLGRLVQGFQTSLLEKKALLTFKEMEEVEAKTKIGAFFDLVNGRLQAARGFEQTGDYDEALPFTMKALDLFKKMESKTNLGVAYSILTRLYARLGNIQRSEEFFEKLMKVPQQNLGNVRVRLSLTKAVLCAAKGQWEEANQHFKESFEVYEVIRGANGDLPAAKLYYSWALEKQGRLEEAKAQLEENRKMRNQIEEKFKQLRLWPSLMVRRRIVGEEEFEMRLDLVNISQEPGLLYKVEEIIPKGFVLTSPLPSWCKLESGSISMSEKRIEPFHVETVKLRLRASQPGTYSLNPKVTYADAEGNTKICEINPITLTVQTEAAA